MDFCTIEFSAILFFVTLIRFMASEIGIRNTIAFPFSICVQFLRHVLYRQKLNAKELDSLITDENRDSILKREKLYDIAEEEPFDNGQTFLEIATLPVQDSTENLLTKDKPTTGLTNASYSSETDNPHTFLQDSEESEDLARLLQEPKTSWNIPIQDCSFKNFFTKDKSSSGLTASSLSTEMYPYSLLQDESSEDMARLLQEPKTSWNIPIQDSSFKNFLTKDKPSTGLTASSFSTKIYPYSLLQDEFSEESEDLDRLLQEPETSRNIPIQDSSFKNFLTKDKPSTGLTASSFATEMYPYSLLQDESSEESEDLNRLLQEPTEIPVVTLPICSVSNPCSITRSEDEEDVQFSLDDLKTSIVEISNSPCHVTPGTIDYSLHVSTIPTKLAVNSFDDSDINKKLFIDVGHSSQIVSSKDAIPAIIVEEESVEFENGNIIQEMEEMTFIQQSALGIVPMEFLYPCLPYFNT